MAVLGTIDPMAHEDAEFRHFLAKIIIIGTLFLILLEIYLGKVYKYSSGVLCARICLLLMKPMMMFHGHTTQMAMLACLF
jgi:hypothetical protein